MFSCTNYRIFISLVVSSHLNWDTSFLWLPRTTWHLEKNYSQGLLQLLKRWPDFMILLLCWGRTLERQTRICFPKHKFLPLMCKTEIRYLYSKPTLWCASLVLNHQEFTSEESLALSWMAEGSITPTALLVQRNTWTGDYALRWLYPKLIQAQPEANVFDFVDLL